MNKTLSIVLISCTVALAGIVAIQWQEGRVLRNQIAHFQLEAAEERAKAAAVEAASLKLTERTEAYKAAAEQLQERNQALAAQTGSGKISGAVRPTVPEAKGAAVAEEAAAEGEAGGNPDFMKGLAKMYSDPKMKEMMRSQQAMGVNMIYGGLAKELGLNKDEAREVLDVLLDRQMQMSESGMKMFEKGSLDPAALEQERQKSTAAREAHNQELRDLLGTERYKKFESYEMTIGERMALEQVEKQLAAGGTPLVPGQSQSLRKIMEEERLRTPVTAPNASSSDPAQQMQALGSEAAVEAWAESQTKLNQRIADRARPILSPDQFEAFERSQKQQQEMQMMGMRMGRQMIKATK